MVLIGGALLLVLGLLVWVILILDDMNMTLKKILNHLVEHERSP
jgi:hypothetical protein